MVWRELASPPHDAPTLQHLGHVEIVYPGIARLPRPQDPGLGDLTAEEWRDFVATILDEARARGVVTPPSIVADRPDGTWYAPIASDFPTAFQRDLVLQRVDAQVLQQLEQDGTEDGNDKVAALITVPGARPRSRTWCYAEAVAAAAGAARPYALPRLGTIVWPQRRGWRGARTSPRLGSMAPHAER